MLLDIKVQCVCDSKINTGIIIIEKKNMKLFSNSHGDIIVLNRDLDVYSGNTHFNFGPTTVG
jgi:translation elongation factor EF-1alpha